MYEPHNTKDRIIGNLIAGAVIAIIAGIVYSIMCALGYS